jgi:hypothetical protein
MGTFFFQPLLFFRQKLDGPPRWQYAAIAPFICVALHAVAYSIIASRTTAPVMQSLRTLGFQVAVVRPMLYIFSVTGSASYLMTWIASTLFLICLDIVFGNDSRRHSRLFELTAYAYYSQIPMLAAVLVLAFTFEPPPFSLHGIHDQELILSYARQYAQEIKTSLPFAFVAVSQYYFQAWLMGLMVVCLAAMSKLSWKRSIVYGVLLYGFFFVLPTVVA